MKLLLFTVPGAPVPYQRPGQLANGGRFTERKTAAYMLLVGSTAARAANARGSGWPKPKIVGGELRGPKGLFELTVTFYRQAHRGDLDNLVKSCADALTKAAIWWDDSMMVSLSAQMSVDTLAPRTLISVEMKGE